MLPSLLYPHLLAIFGYSQYSDTRNIRILAIFGYSQYSDTRNIRTLIKKYHNILNDIQPIVAQLENGEIPGDQVTGVGYPVFKLRIKNSDNQKGKSGGYRLIYYLKTNYKILLLTLYNKSEREDVMITDLKDIIEEYKLSTSEAPSQ